MDILAHALWSVTAGIGIRERLKRPVHLGWMAAWEAPDLIPLARPRPSGSGDL